MIGKARKKDLTDKLVYTIGGNKLGSIKNILIYESGEPKEIVLKNPTKYTEFLNLKKTRENELLIPFNSLVAVGDFVLVSDGDLKDRIKKEKRQVLYTVITTFFILVFLVLFGKFTGYIITNYHTNYNGSSLIIFSIIVIIIFIIKLSKTGKARRK